jgi:hypothetical protein
MHELQEVIRQPQTDRIVAHWLLRVCTAFSESPVAIDRIRGSLIEARVPEHFLPSRPTWLS